MAVLAAATQGGGGNRARWKCARSRLAPRYFAVFLCGFDEVFWLRENIASRECVIRDPFLKSGPVAQLGARFHGMEEVVGSIPTRSTK